MYRVQIKAHNTWINEGTKDFSLEKTKKYANLLYKTNLISVRIVDSYETKVFEKLSPRIIDNSYSMVKALKGF
jgi:hypothetical protein